MGSLQVHVAAPYLIARRASNSSYAPLSNSNALASLLVFVDGLLRFNDLVNYVKWSFLSWISSSCPARDHPQVRVN